MRRVSALLLLLACLIGFAAAQDVRKLALSEKFVSPECRVRFNYPAKWHVVAFPGCQFRIHRFTAKNESKDSMDLDVYGIDISIIEGEFENAAKKEGFEHRDGKWFYQGESEVDADPIKGGNYLGLMVDDFSCRNYDENGYAGMGDCAAGIVASKGRAASFYENPQSIDLLPRIVRSFRFEASAASKPDKP